MAYTDKVDHYSSPRNVGLLDKKEPRRGRGTGGRAGSAATSWS